jgi:hypothetical protein
MQPQEAAPVQAAATSGRGGAAAVASSGGMVRAAPAERGSPAGGARGGPAADTSRPEGTARPPAAVLADRLPTVTSILVAPDRRLAIVDGAIVREGDAVGRRVVVRIEPEAVVLREPSGREVRVRIVRRVGGGGA